MFRFQIRKDHDGRHRWYIYNAAGTIVGSHTGGFPSELEAYEDIEHVRKALGMAQIVGELVEVDGGPGGAHETGG
jgi:uncharacterized protein YegP (UPF0339 family)